MEKKVIQEGQGLRISEKSARLNPDEGLAGSKPEPRFKPKGGSVFPAKRKLVKRMMFDWFLETCCRPSGSGASQSNNAGGGSDKSPPPKSSNGKCKMIHPHTP